VKTELILSNIARQITLEDDEKSYFLSLLVWREVRRKEFLLNANERCDQISFVNAGALRAFYRDANDKESTIMFAVADWWITDMPCFVNQSPAMISIEAIADTTVMQLSKNSMDKLLTSVPKFERYFRVLMQNAYIREQMRVLQNLSMPAEVRYENFLKKYPAISGQVTQKHIASYLGITPEFLSVIRGKTAKG
jgi:CRP-like cAMP-binding protein